MHACNSAQDEEFVFWLFKGIHNNYYFECTTATSYEASSAYSENGKRTHNV